MRTPPTAPDATFALLVVDDDGTEARRFRSTSALPDMTGVDASGLAELRCSGSAQPSALAFDDIRARLAHVPAASLYVVDLRKESHAFVNGAAVSWYAESNWGTAGLSDDDALALEAIRARLLAASPAIRVGSVDAVKRGGPPSFVEWEPRSVALEADALGLAPDRYARIPVVDHARPSDAVVDRFVAFARALPDGAHVHVHCRGGKGRTATFMALLDMMHHAARLPLATIVDRQARLGDYDVRKEASAGSKKAPFIAERRAFLERFYAYARENPRGAPATWSAWSAASPLGESAPR